MVSPCPVAQFHLAVCFYRVHVDVRQQVGVQGRPLYGNPHVLLYLCCRACGLPYPDLVHRAFPPRLAASVAEPKVAEARQSCVGLARYLSLAYSVHVCCHEVALYDDCHVAPSVGWEAVGHHHPVARRGVPSGIEHACLVRMEEELAPSRSYLLYVVGEA